MLIDTNKAAQDIYEWVSLCFVELKLSQNLKALLVYTTGKENRGCKVFASEVKSRKTMNLTTDFSWRYLKGNVLQICHFLVQDHPSIHGHKQTVHWSTMMYSLHNQQAKYMYM